MIHRRYADGTPRPLLRGALHLLLAAPFTWHLVTQTYPLAALPALGSIAATLWASAALHVYPWQSIRSEELMFRLDRAGVLLISMWSYLTPALVDGDAAIAPGTAALCIGVPHLIALHHVAAGSRARGVFAPSLLGQLVVTLAWWGSVGAAAALRWSTITIACYAAALALHKRFYNFHAVYWGYHEWMHVLVTVGFYTNVQCVLELTRT